MFRRIHQSQITSNHALLSVISKLRSSTKQRVSEMRVGAQRLSVTFTICSYNSSLTIASRVPQYLSVGFNRATSVY